MLFRKAATGQPRAFTPINLSVEEQTELLADRWELIAAALSPRVMIPARELAEAMAVCVRTMGLINQVDGGPLEYQKGLRKWREATAHLEGALATQKGHEGDGVHRSGRT